MFKKKNAEQNKNDMKNIAKLAMHLKICPFRPNSTQEEGRNTIVFLPTLLSRSSSSLRALQQNRL